MGGSQNALTPVATVASIWYYWQYRLDDEPLTCDENLFESRSQYFVSAELSF
jgi:hypothetical protein